MEVLLSKTPGGALVPIDDDEAAKLAKIKQGPGVRCEITQMRNYAFHQKFFVMLGYIYSIWEETMPRMEYRGVEVRPNKERFRKDLIIMTGRYEATYNIRGEVRLEAHSISFGSMNQETFDQLYSDVIDVALRKVLNRPDLSEAKVKEHVEYILRFS